MSDKPMHARGPAMRTVLAIAAPLIAIAFGGCVADPGPKAAASDDGHAHDLPALGLTTSKCVQAGGNSLYEMQEGRTKVGPFFAADQRAQVGNPIIGAYGRPVLGPQNGIWHVAVVCDSYMVDGKTTNGFEMGWIAQMIKRPDFDTDGPELQFFVADLSFNDAAFVKALDEATGGAEVSLNSEASINILPGEKYMRVVISEARHGTFDFTAELHKEFGKKTTEDIRFWMLVATDGSHHHDGLAGGQGGETLYRPVAIDIHDEADGTGRKLAGESAGTFAHIQDLNKPGANHFGNPLGHVQTGFNRTISLGPMPDNVLFNVTWLH